MNTFKIACRLSRHEALANVSTDVAEIETNLDRIALLADEAAAAGDDVAHGICKRATMGDAEYYLRALEMLAD